MEPERIPLLPLGASRFSHYTRKIRESWVLPGLINTWIILAVIGYLFLQQENSSILSSINLNGGLLEGLDGNLQPVGIRDSCDGIWSCSRSICDIYLNSSSIWVASRYPGSCPYSTNISTSWDIYGGYVAFRLSRVLLYLVIPLQLIAVGLRFPSQRFCVNFFGFITSLATLLCTEISYLTWIVFLAYFRRLTGDPPPPYLDILGLMANLFILVTLPFIYLGTWLLFT